jgi:hypothetical protein
MKHRSVSKKKLIHCALRIADAHPDEARFLRKVAETRKVTFDAEAGTLIVPHEHLGKTATLISMSTERFSSLLNASAGTNTDLLFFLRRSHIDVTLVHKKKSLIQLQQIMDAVNYLVFSPI